jgi:hypothetical protein
MDTCYTFGYRTEPVLSFCAQSQQSAWRQGTLCLAAGAHAQEEGSGGLVVGGVDCTRGEAGEAGGEEGARRGEGEHGGEGEAGGGGCAGARGGWGGQLRLLRGQPGRDGGETGLGLGLAAGTAVLELGDPVCEGAEMGDGADEDLELELLLRLVAPVVVVRVVWRRDELAEGGEGVVDFCAAGLFDERVVRLALCLAGGTREGARSAAATLGGVVGRDGHGRVCTGPLGSAGRVARRSVHLRLRGGDGTEGHGASRAGAVYLSSCARTAIGCCPHVCPTHCLPCSVARPRASGPSVAAHTPTRGTSGPRARSSSGTVHTAPAAPADPPQRRDPQRQDPRPQLQLLCPLLLRARCRSVRTPTVAVAAPDSFPASASRSSPTTRVKCTSCSRPSHVAAESPSVDASRRMVARYDLVVTSGGIGPTHDGPSPPLPPPQLTPRRHHVRLARKGLPPATQLPPRDPRPHGGAPAKRRPAHRPQAHGPLPTRRRGPLRRP